MPFDILLDDDYDLLVKDGDFVIGESTAQEIDLILRSEPGHWRDNLLLGFGLIKRIKSAQDKLQLKKDADTHLRLDGFSDINIVVDKQGLISEITADRI